MILLNQPLTKVLVLDLLTAKNETDQNDDKGKNKDKKRKEDEGRGLTTRARVTVRGLGDKGHCRGLGGQRSLTVCGGG